MEFQELGALQGLTSELGGGGGRKGNSRLPRFVLSGSQAERAGSENEGLISPPSRGGAGTISWDAAPAHPMVALGVYGRETLYPFCGITVGMGGS